MSIVLLALVPPLFFGIYNTGYQSVAASGGELRFFDIITSGLFTVMPLIIVSYVAGFFWEILFSVIRRHPISEGFLVTGLLYPMTLPPTMPLWQVAVGISFGVVIGKEVFGGTGRNIFNPALTARAFVFFAYPAQMSGDAVWVAVRDAGTAAVTGATPLAMTTLAGSFNSLEAMLQDAGFTLTRLFVGNYPGSVGATSALCCLIGALLLIITGVASYRVMIGGIVGLLATSFLIGIFSSAPLNPWANVNPLYHLAAGGFMFGIVYMATDPVSGPGTTISKWVYGFLIGMLTVLIRVFNPAFPEGVMMAILFMNLFCAAVLILSRYGCMWQKGFPMSDRMKSIVFALMLCLVCSSLLTAASTRLQPMQEKNFQIDRKKNILRSVSLIEPGRKYSNDEIEKLYKDNIFQYYVDGKGTIVSPETVENPELSGLLPLYLAMDANNRIRSYIIPVESNGLWGKIHGYMALKDDGATIEGFTVYKHSETPGLGGEIENQWFQENFVGKKIVNPENQFVAVSIAKGSAADKVTKEKLPNYVDGISGATLTGQYLTQGLHRILKKYEPVSLNFRQNALQCRMQTHEPWCEENAHE